MPGPTPTSSAPVAPAPVGGAGAVVGTALAPAGVGRHQAHAAHPALRQLVRGRDEIGRHDATREHVHEPHHVVGRDRRVELDPARAAPFDALQQPLREEAGPQHGPAVDDELVGGDAQQPRGCPGRRAVLGDPRRDVGARLADARVHGPVELGVHQREEQAFDDGGHAGRGGGRRQARSSSARERPNASRPSPRSHFSSTNAAAPRTSFGAPSTSSRRRASTRTTGPASDGLKAASVEVA